MSLLTSLTSIISEGYYISYLYYILPAWRTYWHRLLRIVTLASALVVVSICWYCIALLCRFERTLTPWHTASFHTHHTVGLCTLHLLTRALVGQMTSVCRGGRTTITSSATCQRKLVLSKLSTRWRHRNTSSKLVLLITDPLTSIRYSQISTLFLLLFFTILTELLNFVAL